MRGVLAWPNVEARKFGDSAAAAVAACSNECVWTGIKPSLGFFAVAGARVYVTMFPCNECAKLMIQARHIAAPGCSGLDCSAGRRP